MENTSVFGCPAHRYLIAGIAKRVIVPLLLILWLPASASAQNSTTVSGYVKDDNGNPLIGATVVIVGTSTGVITGAKGEFSIASKLPMTIKASYVGYESRDIRVSAATASLEIILMEETNRMEEIVVIGYGAVRKTDLTGSVTNVNMTDINSSSALSVDQALQGRVPGADILSTTGEPGATTSIRIRGTRSISASNEPLIVVDGVMDAVSDLNDINSADIESISILKDASSTAIYGSRGSNGVIIITTKKGSSGSGKPNITFKGDVGFSYLPSGLDLMTGAEYAQYRNDLAYFTNGGLAGDLDGVPISSAPYKYADPLSKGKGTDWVGNITRTAPTQNYNISVTGGSKKSSYFVSLAYNNSRGIIDNSGIQRYTGRINLSHQLLKWLKVGYSGSYTLRDQDRNLAAVGGTSISSGAIYLSPLLKITDNYNPDYEDGIRINTPRATIDLNTYNEIRNTSSHSINFDANICQGLTFRSQNSYYLTQQHLYRYYPSTLPKKNPGEGGEAYRAENGSWSLATENTLTYDFKTDNGHKLNVLAGFTAYKYKSDNFSLSGSGYMDDEVKWNNLTGVLDKNTYSASSGTGKTTKMSLLARVNYNYESRYYITLTGRYDAASNFAKNNKWGFFPSAALKWNVANEVFMEDVSWVDELSVRLSAGRTGNDAIAAYRSIERLSTSSNGYLFDGQQQASYYRDRIPSPNLTWEKTDLYNIAADISLFNERLNLTAEGYISKTRDLLMDVQVANQTGFETQFVNLGKTTNKGWELSIESRNIVRPKFSWSTQLTLAQNKQSVDNIGSSEFVVVQTSEGNDPYMMQGFKEGFPLNALWGFRYAGTWKNVDEFKRNEVTHAYASSGTIIDTNYATSLGLPRYHDINGDGILNQDDLAYLGNADPVLYGGLQNTFHIGNLRLGVYFTYSLGGKIYNYSELFMAGGNRTNQYGYMQNSWHPVRNPESDYPRAGGTLSKAVPSDFMVYDASYLRLKNVSVSYTFKMKKANIIRDITVTAMGENLWLWKKYNGFDPDVSSSGTSSTLRRVDLGAYPKPRTFVFSVQIRY